MKARFSDLTGMFFSRWLFGNKQAGKAPVAQTATQLCWAPVGDFNEACVGTSYYRAALQNIACNPPGEWALVFCVARLQPEPNNPHDAKAVAVYINGAKVAHLAKERAAGYHTRLAPPNGTPPHTFCKAVISNGQITPDRTYDYTVELDIALETGLPEGRDTVPPKLHRSAIQSPLTANSDGTYTARTWITKAGREDIRVGTIIEPWHSDKWATVAYFASNAIGVGLGHKMYETSKAQFHELFGVAETFGTVTAIDGRIATVVIQAGPSPDGRLPRRKP